MNDLTPEHLLLLGALKVLRNHERESWVTLNETEAQAVIAEIERLREANRVLQWRDNYVTACLV